MPGLHGSHFIAPAFAAKCIAGHFIQDLAPAMSEYSPGGHDIQEVAPDMSEYVPTGHRRQEVASDRFEYVPTGHTSHTPVDADKYLPGLHRVGEFPSMG